MKCITYGTTIVLMIILTVIVNMILIFIGAPPNSDVVSLGLLGLSIGSFMLLLWWLYGWFSKCEEGYMWGRGLRRY